MSPNGGLLAIHLQEAVIVAGTDVHPLPRIIKQGTGFADAYGILNADGTTLEILIVALDKILAAG